MKKEARFYQKLKNHEVQYLILADQPVISNYAVDKSGVLLNEEGVLYQLNYGQVISTSKSLVSKELPSVGVAPGSDPLLKIGFIGNNFRTSFDPNWDSGQLPFIKQLELGRIETNVFVENTGTYLSPDQLLNYLQQNVINSVLFSISEPAVNFTFIADFLDLKSEISVYLRSNGYFNYKSASSYLKQIKAIDIELHSTDVGFYKKHCRADVRLILQLVKECANESINIEISTTLIPDVNDDERSLSDIANFLASLKVKPLWKFGQFQPAYRMLDKKKTSEESVEFAQNLANKYGLESSVTNR